MTTTYRPDCFDAAAIAAGLPFGVLDADDTVLARFGTAEAAWAWADAHPRRLDLVPFDARTGTAL